MVYLSLIKPASFNKDVHLGVRVANDGGSDTREEGEIESPESSFKKCKKKLKI